MQVAWYIQDVLMDEPARKRATYEDVLAAPPHGVAEVLFGVLYTHPRPACAHAKAASVLGMDLGGPFDRGRGGPGGWIVLDEPELHLGDDIIVPDLAGWQRQRLPEVPSGAYFTLAPDWICEVLSRSTQAVDRTEKMEIYAREGVRHAWLVDPVARTLEVYRLQATDWLRVATWRDDATVRAEPFDAIELELSALWIRHAIP
jgi:Uma2 family endonuclease